MTVDEEIRHVLEKHRTIAVVGLSRDPSKDSYRVAIYLKEQGYRIIPINPSGDEILGEKSYKALLDLPEELQRQVEIVDIFRPASDVPPIVDQTIEMKKRHGTPQVVWMQLGIVDEEAAKKARDAGLTVVMDRCMMVEHKRLLAANKRQ